MALDHHRAARRQRRGRVAPGSRKGEREVRGAEDRDRADRPLHQLQVGARQGLAVGQRRIMAAVEVVALADMGGEQAQLAGGPAPLAVQPRRGQAGFGRADGGDLDAPRLDLVGDPLEEGSALVAAGLADSSQRPLRPRARRGPHAPGVPTEKSSASPWAGEERKVASP